MIFGSPVRGQIYLSPGTVDGHARWFRSQRFGCTGFSWEAPLGTCSHYHRAIDIARGSAGCGDDLIAMQSGTVIYSGTLNSGAKAVVVRHAGGYASGAAHMSSLSVTKGQSVKRGQKLGTIGSTGNSTGCHDHACIKGSFPTWGGVNEFFRDAVGKWLDPWPRLQQNVTVRPKGDGIRIRNADGSIYATTQSDGRIHRKSDNSDRGATSTMRKWNWTITKAFAGTSETLWEQIWLDGAWRLVGRSVSVRSMS